MCTHILQTHIHEHAHTNECMHPLTDTQTHAHVHTRSPLPPRTANSHPHIPTPTPTHAHMQTHIYAPLPRAAVFGGLCKERKILLRPWQNITVDTSAFQQCPTDLQGSKLQGSLKREVLKGVSHLGEEIHGCNCFFPLSLI